MRIVLVCAMLVRRQTNTMPTSVGRRKLSTATNPPGERAVAYWFAPALMHPISAKTYLAL
jgi:hypothetical protein